MARYNTSSAATIITGATTISSPSQGAFTNLTGTAPYTVTLPAPALFPGSNQTFYNSTAGSITLSTPSGLFGGLGASGTSSLVILTNTVTSVTSDGTNYIVLSEDGSALVATTGSFTGNVDMSGGSATVTISPQSLTMSPSSGVINNVSIGGTTRSTGAFTSLTANSTVSFTANTSSSSTTTGSLVVTGGIGVSGTVFAGGFNGNLTGTLTGNMTGTVLTAAQPNITSLGTLTGLTISGRLQNAGGLKTYSVQTGGQGNVNAVYEIMKISRDNVNWSPNTVYEITVYSTYYPAGGYTKYLLSYGYFNDGSLVCTYAGGSGMLRVYLGAEVSVNANCQYKPVFVDLPPYMQCSVEVRYNTTEVASVGSINGSAQVFFSNIMTASGGTGAFYNGNTHLVPNGGNLGVGTTTPDTPLHVKTGSTGTNFKLEGPTGRYLYSGNDSGTYLEQVGTSSSDRVFRIQNSNGSGAYTQLFFDGANQKIYTSSNVNVGIGMNNPQTVLHVSGTNQNIFLDNFGVGQTGLKLRYQTNSLHGANFLYTPNDATAFIENTYQSSSGTVYGDIYFRQNIAGTMTTRLTVKADGGLVSASNDFQAGGKLSARGQRVQRGTFSAFTTSGDSNTYWHFKTSIKANRDVTMQAVRAEGYAYGNATLIDCRWGWHTDSSGNLYSKAYLTNGTGPSANNLYVAADGFTVVVLYVASTYYSSVTFSYIQSEMYGETPFSITAWTRTASASGAY